MNAVIKSLSVLLADTYALYLKTQNYHWHVRGLNFKTLHELFEVQYRELAEAVDAIAERIRILGHKAPATFRAFDDLKTIADGNPDASEKEMLQQLAKDNATLVNYLNQSLEHAEAAKDEGTITLFADRIAAHEKAHWMLSVSAG